MSKITFRADDDLVRRLEALEGSKSEVMREALRAYLEDVPADVDADADSFDALITDQIDRRIDERFDAGSPAVNVNVTIEDDRGSDDRRREPDRQSVPSATADDRRCRQCGEAVENDHVYCPNCGEKAVNRAFCECGDELRSDWSFCPGCGRRTPAADVLE